MNVLETTVPILKTQLGQQLQNGKRGICFYRIANPADVFRKSSKTCNIFSNLLFTHNPGG